jgi:hypothetical protein
LWNALKRQGFPLSDFFWQGDNRALLGRRRLAEQKMQLAGFTDGGWVYTRQQPAVQNGNSGLSLKACSA